MSNRWLALVPGLAALACAIIVLYLAIQIDQTRKQLQNDGVLEFNFVQQVDHNLDTLAQALMSYLVTNESDKNSLKAAYIKQYDIVYSSIKSVNDRWLGNLAELQATDAFFDAANNFLDRYELSMSIDVELESSQLIQINQEALELSKQVYEIGLQMFERKSTARNQISQRMDELYFSQRMFGLFFALTLLLTIALLVAMYRRAAILQSAAVTTGVQLSTALDELTTGNNERRAQNRFMAAASHDLRQPLHALGLYLSSLERYIPSAEGKNILANTHRSTEALKQLLNSMLDLSKLDAGVVDIDPVNLDLDALFNHLLQSFLPEAKQRQLAFDVQFSGLAVNSDRLLLERILGNLVANALSYTEVGQVSLRATALESQVCISISDTGSGIPVHEQEAIFDEFYQLQNPERDRNKGLGLGLSIVKRLTRLLKLDLKIKSEEGKGTTFQLMLPRASETETRFQETGVSAISAPDDLTGLSILIIDDEQEVREGMRTWLVQKECEVLLADSIDQALELIVAISWIPDLIIADYRLRNNETGDSAIVKVREEVNVDIPAMIITGDTSPARLREATASGFHLLHKPVVVEDLLSIISELVREFRLASSNVEVSGKSNQVKYS